MAIGVFAIAQGAAKVAGKLFTAVKNQRDKKVQKAANRLLDAQTRQLRVNQVFNTPGIIQNNDPVDSLKKPKFISSLGSLINPDAGSLAISGAANALQAVKGGEPVNPRNAQLVAEEVSGGSNMKFDPKWLLYGAIALIAFPFIKKLLR
jgi:hypothetical protein